MKAGQGKAKGSGYEREVGAKLSLWLSHGQRKDLICRTVGSGAQFTTAAKKSISAGHAGDLMSQGPSSYDFFSKYICECKFWKDLKFLQFLSGKGELYKAMIKVQREAKSVNKRWWLVTRQNHQKDILLMERKIITSALPTDSCPMYHGLFCGTVIMWYLDEFLKNVNPERYLE